jgi:hypothetical protein
MNASFNSIGYIRHYNTRDSPFHWSDSNQHHCIKSTDLSHVTGH